MTDASNFTKLVPGFDFLQGLVKNAGAALPSMGQWVAPTLNPEELEKRIEELRTVQFWLEQNARMLGATIQALEVQRMTLSTLKTMNVQMEDLRDSLKIKVPGAELASQALAGGAAAAASAVKKEAPARKSSSKKADALASGLPGVDPMQWWGALTKQFTELATTAMKDTATDAAKNLGSAMLKQSVEAASETLKKAATVPAQMARSAAKTAGHAASMAGAAAVGAKKAAAASKAARTGAPKATRSAKR